MKCLRFVSLMWAGLLLPACVSVEKAAPPVAMLSAAKPANRDRLEQGRQIFVTRCTKCHWAKEIAARSREEWVDDILPRMTKKAKLDANQSGEVQAYVLAALQPLLPQAHN